MRALVVSGGGAKIPFELGAVEALAQGYAGGKGYTSTQRLPWDLQAGVSAGALVVAGLAGGRWGDFVRLRTRILGIRHNGDIYRHRPWGLLRLLAKNGASLYDPGPLKRLMADAVDLGAARVEGAPQTLVGYVDLVSGRYKTAVATDEDFLDAALASASMPGFFPGIVHPDARHVDGGVRNISPLADVLKAGATHVDVVLASPLRVAPWAHGWDSILGRVQRALSILMNEVFVNDLRVLDHRNRHPIPGDRHVEVRVVAPEREWASGTLSFDPKVMLAAYQDGLVLGEDPWPLERALEHYKVG